MKIKSLFLIPIISGLFAFVFSNTLAGGYSVGINNELLTPDDPIITEPQPCDQLQLIAGCPSCPIPDLSDNNDDLTVCQGTVVNFALKQAYINSKCIYYNLPCIPCCNNPFGSGCDDCVGGACDAMDCLDGCDELTFSFSTNYPNPPLDMPFISGLEYFFSTKWYMKFPLDIPGTWWFKLEDDINSLNSDIIYITVTNELLPIINLPGTATNFVKVYDEIFYKDFYFFEYTACEGANLVLNPGGNTSNTYNWVSSLPISCTNCPSPTITISTENVDCEVEITSPSGCTNKYIIAFDAITFFSGVAPTVTITKTDATCSGIYADGTAIVTVTSGTPPYTYQWNNGQTNSIASGLDAGSYYVTVSDASGCSTMASANILYPFTIDCDNCTLYSDLTWSNSTIRVKGLLTIGYGTLTINNCTVEFLYDNNGQAGIKLDGDQDIVKLVINGSTLTGCNDGTWNGIDGSTSGAFLTNVTISNTSVIKNMVEGIVKCQISAVNSSFVNNKISVLEYGFPSGFSGPIGAPPFIYPSTSVIEKCTFEYNSSTPHPLGAFVALSLADGMKLRGNTFINSTPNDFPASQRGYGIVSVDARYTVEPACNSMCGADCAICCGTPGKFKNLYYGIYGINSDFTLPVTIRGKKDNVPDFENCTRGILLRGIDFATVVENEFKGGVTTGDFFEYALYLDNVTGFEVEENKILDNYLAGAGFIINQTNSPSDKLYRNEFNGTEISTQIQGNNPNLQIKCNTYNNPVGFADIAVTSSGTLPEQGQCLQSGSLAEVAKAPAGNTFSHTCTPPASLNSDILVDLPTPDFIYNHHNDAPRTLQCYNSTIVNSNECTGLGFGSSSCPSAISTNICFDTDDWDELIINVNGIKYEISIRQNLLARGDGQWLIDMIHQNLPPGNIKDSIMAVSPYASDRVLLAALTEKATPLPPGIIKDILIANSPLTDAVKQVLSHLNLPKGIVAQINQLQSGINPCVQLESEIAYYERERIGAINDIVRVFLNSPNLTRQQKLDSVHLIMKVEGLDFFKCRTFALLVLKGDTADARIQLTDAHPDGNLDNYCALYKIILDLLSNEKNCFEMATDFSLKNRVLQIAQETKEPGCVNARALLELVFKQRFPEIIEPVPGQFSAKKMGNWNSMNNSMQDSIVKKMELNTKSKNNLAIYPNPANKVLIVDYRFSLNGSSVEICFFDVFGNSHKYFIKQDNGKLSIDLADWENGLYYYTVLLNNSIAHRGKIIILR